MQGLHSIQVRDITSKFYPENQKHIIWTWVSMANKALREHFPLTSPCRRRLRHFPTTGVSGTVPGFDTQKRVYLKTGIPQNISIHVNLIRTNSDKSADLPKFGCSRDKIIWHSSIPFWRNCASCCRGTRQLRNHGFNRLVWSICRNHQEPPYCFFMGKYEKISGFRFRCSLKPINGVFLKQGYPQLSSFSMGLSMK